MKKRKKSKIQIYDVVVVIVRLVFFLLFPALFSSAFTGIKEIVGKIASLESLEWSAFVSTLVVLLAITILFGRIFCGFACAFGTYGDFLYFLSSWVQKKRHKKPLHVFAPWAKALKYLKYFVLLAVLVLCVLNRQSFVSQNSPWTAFSLLQSGKFPGLGLGLALLGLISIGMFLEPRFFCRFLCPMGAIFAMMPVMPWAVIKRDRSNCLKGCSLCQRNCPAAIEIPDAADHDSIGMGECFACGKCKRGCPKKNIYRVRAKKKEEAKAE